MIPPEISVARGEVWRVRFDPSEGDEIQKIRPAVVMTAKSAGRMRLQIVVPLTGWKPHFNRYFWMVYVAPATTNGLQKESAADAFQIKSLSINRFSTKLGELTAEEMQEITTAIALCIGYTSDDIV